MENAAGQPIIEFDNVSKSYGSATGIENVSFCVKSGDFFALLGPNGAGKSTAIRLLAALAPVSRGQIRFNGVEVSSRPALVRSAMGVVFQTPSLDEDLTADENLMLHIDLYGVSRRMASQRIMAAMRLVGLAEKSRLLVKTFSGGLKRRLEVARAILHQPRVLILDEPTLGLDTQARSSLWSYLRRMNQEQGLTVFFTTHYMHEVEEIATHVVVIDHGRVVESGSVGGIKDRAAATTLEGAYLALTSRGGEQTE